MSQKMKRTSEVDKYFGMAVPLFSMRLHLARKDCSQRELGKVLNVTPTTISNWENAKMESLPSMPSLTLFSAHCKCDPNQILSTDMTEEEARYMQHFRITGKQAWKNGGLPPSGGVRCILDGLIKPRRTRRKR